MDKFLLLSDEDKRAYFEVAAADLNIMPQLIEKDFWVCWTLKILFSLPRIGSHLTFKGGTSLLKCYNLIKRFSEDIDISIERSFLTSEGSIEPDKEQSGNENKRRLERLKQACQEKVSEIIIPELSDKIDSVLSSIGEWKIELDPDDPDKQTILFAFPNVITSSIENYNRPIIKIELGARSDHWPIETKTVTPYVANVSGDISIVGTPVRVLGAERTFWEKATILHAIYNSSKLRAKMSRHYYDIFEMVNSSVFKKALENIDLLTKVAEHKSLFFKENKARYDLARPSSLKLFPRDDQISLLKIDYSQMEQMFFDEPPSFDSILEKLKCVEDEINKI